MTKRGLQAGAASIEERVSSEDRIPQSPHLNSAHAAAYLDFPSVKAFHRWLVTNRLPKLRCGGRILFERRVLDAYLRGELTLHKPVTVRLVHGKSVGAADQIGKSRIGTKGL